jgi:hypothetical protein
MGGSSSKQSAVDPNVYLKQAEQQLKPLATVSETAAQDLQAKALQAQAMAEQAASSATAKAGQLMFYLKSFGGVVVFGVVLLCILYLIDYISIKYYNKSTIGLLRIVGSSSDKPDGTVKSAGIASIFSSSIESGDLLPKLQDASKQTLVAGKDLPLSADKQGGYGMQWWMFINDWNYGYGKEKGVLIRSDPTSQKILNPSISLHPTDNSLKISVSVFPEKEGGSSSTQPAPAVGGAGSTDDVFICEVPNLPLQTWFAVTATVFGRNLDVYIDGNLVKSCLLSGVPKPALGDIILSPNGGFSGYMCNFKYFARMLTPGDASNFHSGGTSCKDKVPNNGTGGGTGGTGYSVRFGVYDTGGKVVKEYSF